MFFKVLDITNWTCITLLCVSVLLLIYKIFYHVYSLMPARQFPEAKKNHKYAIIVPARNESAVIEGLLKSFEAQTYPKELYDIYVVVESETDPTVEICKKFANVQSFVRPDLKVKSKGGALDHCFKYILNSGIAKDKGYEAYYIFDADNVVTPNYLFEMNKSFDAGYELALSYRNSKNWNDGWVASCSALTFTMLNTFQNKCRARFNQNVLVSGTGFYIAARIINELGGWPFQSLTEDYEISNFAVLNGIKGTYNENAEYLDEQPVKLKVSWNQRIRWVKGQIQVSKKYSKPLLKSALYSKENRWAKFEFGVNIIPIIVPLATIIVYCFMTLILGIVGACNGVPEWQWHMAFINFATGAAGLYVFYVFYTLAMILSERKHIDLKFKNALVTLIMNPFFMGLYLPIYFVALFKKEIKWKPIERKTIETCAQNLDYSNSIVATQNTEIPSTEEIKKELDAEFINK